MSKPIKTGLFISVEGADGCGKTTQTKFIVERFKQLGYDVVHTRELGGTQVAEQIRNVLVNSNPDVEEVHPNVQVMLAFASRYQHLMKVIIPALRAGKVVVTDRYTDSTDVYQGMIGRTNAFITSLYDTKILSLLSIRPDFTFYLDVDPDVSQQRMKTRANDNADEFFGKHNPAVLYMQLFAKVIDLYGTDVIKIVDANHDLEDVQSQISLLIDEVIECVPGVELGNALFVQKTSDIMVR